MFKCDNDNVYKIMELEVCELNRVVTFLNSMFPERTLAGFRSLRPTCFQVRNVNLDYGKI